MGQPYPRETPADHQGFAAVPALRRELIAYLLPPGDDAPAGCYFQGEEFLRSLLAPEPSSCHLYAGHHRANKQAPARLVPGCVNDDATTDATLRHRSTFPTRSETA